ncbi:MAG: hypothetical protein KDI65_09385 [Alphaproteobacteria bacterium]|nr:hypothetical protein [Alphaproteobacteria bacterium]
MIENKTKGKLIAAAVLAISAFTSVPAYAQMSEQPWSFSPQNRASIAALIHSVEDGNNSGGTISGGSGGIVNLVCGKDGDTSATANNTCIILNNSEGASVDILQDSTGDQTATSDNDTTVDETIVENTQGIDDVLDTLANN